MAAETPAPSADAAPQTPTTARGQRSMLRKNSATSISDVQMEPPLTPSRRSTRTAAIRATSLIHDAVEESTGSRRRATPARKAADYNSGQSSGDDTAPKTPSRRTKEPSALLLSPTTRRATRSTSAERDLEDGADLLPPPLATPRKRAAGRKTTATENEEDAANTLALMAATPRKPSTRGSVADSGDDNADVAIKTPARRGRPPKAAKESDEEPAADTAEAEVKKTPARRGRPPKVAVDVADELAEVAEAMKTPTRRGRGRAAKASNEAADDEIKSESTESEILSAITAKTSQSSSVTLPPRHPDLAGVAKKLASLAVEPEACDPPAITSGTQSVDGEEFRTAPESPEKAALHTAAAVPEEAEDDISDLSDVENPQFTKIMSAAAESATISAAESLAGSDVETDSVSARPARGIAPSGKPATHIAFDSDVEMDSEPEQLPAAAQKPADSDSDSDDDEAPEVVVTSRAKAASEQQPQASAPESEDDEAAAPDSKSSKKKRPRHRKRPVSVTAAQHAAAAMENVAEMNRRPGHVLPSEIPEELRVDLASELAARAAAKGARAAKAGSSSKLDLAVLEQFAAESKKRSGDAAGSKKIKKRKHKKSQDDGSSRVVSGIRVVATEQPTSKMGLLENLAQSVPLKVRKFAKEERSGGRRIKRSDPLVAIARRNNHAAINFFKPSAPAQ